MKAFLAACAALAIITVAASFVLDNAGFSAREQTTSSSVRLDP